MRIATTFLALLLLSGCSASLPVISEKLDPATGATVTHGRTPLVLYSDNSAKAAYARDFVYIGPLAVNRMGEHHYFLWLGIWSSMDDQGMSEQRDGFDTVVIYADGEPLSLNIEGWTLSSIGVSEPIYNRPTATAADAYYPVTMDQIRLIAAATDVRLRTAGPRARSYEPWDSQAQAFAGMQAFVRYLSF
jgi:hypothetical protein